MLCEIFHKVERDMGDGLGKPPVVLWTKRLRDAVGWGVFTVWIQNQRVME